MIETQGGAALMNSTVTVGRDFVGRDKTTIINNYWSAGGAERDAESLQAQIDRYLNWVVNTYGKIALRGVQRAGSSVIVLDLDTAYVPLEATITRPAEERRSLATHEANPARPVEERKGFIAHVIDVLRRIGWQSPDWDKEGCQTTPRCLPALPRRSSKRIGHMRPRGAPPVAIALARARAI
ncbi:MAG: hypothetical protein RMN52_02690 [Anaerolineae bacterium]|nr:hypothetical protein [Candidatus Roseilinea sp.]MDW8448887.1 hypothetical protein [Anaerolineae bacterium]